MANQWGIHLQGSLNHTALGHLQPLMDGQEEGRDGGQRGAGEGSFSGRSDA